MSEITKCLGHKCDKKESCLRYTHEDAFWQSYFHKTPFEVVGEDQICEHFISNKGEKH